MRRDLAILRYVCTQTSRAFITYVFPQKDKRFMVSYVEHKNFGDEGKELLINSLH